MMRNSSLGLFAALSLAVSVFGVGCAGSSEDAGSDDSAATAGSTALGSDFSGTIGGKPVHIRLAAQGAAVTGSYFYDSVAGNGSLVLKGTRTGNKLTLTETVNGKGAATGTWTGTIGANGVTGTWKSPTGSSLPLAMTEIKPGTNAVVTHKTKQDVKFTGQGGGLGDCSLDATVVEVFGLADAAAEAAINKALTPEPLDLDAQGKCSEFDDIRTINHTVTLNANGFLTVSVNEEDDGGAHPEISIEYFNFRLSDGARFTAKDFFAADAGAALRTMVVNHINAETDLSADDKKDALDELDTQWASDGSMSLDSIQFGVTDKGITLDMTNNYPHVVLALAPTIDFTWSDLKSVLKADAPIASLIH